MRICMENEQKEVESMPNIKSSKKDVISSKIAYEKNKADKSELKTNLKKFDAAVAEGNRDSEAEQAGLISLKISPSEQCLEGVFSFCKGKL